LLVVDGHHAAAKLQGLTSCCFQLSLSTLKRFSGMTQGFSESKTVENCHVSTLGGYSA
jgi:hypothetical protein